MNKENLKKYFGNHTGLFNRISGASMTIAGAGLFYLTTQLLDKTPADAKIILEVYNYAVSSAMMANGLGDLISGQHNSIVYNLPAKILNKFGEAKNLEEKI